MQFATLTLIMICNTIFIGGCITMSFKITKKETENKTIRFPLELIDKIEKAIQGEDTTFSRFVILACEYALKNMEKEKPKEK